MDTLKFTANRPFPQAPPQCGSPLIPNDCPKFSHCTAPICPLDPEWASRTYLKGEGVCFFTLEHVKPGARARFQGSTAEQIYDAISDVLPSMIARYAPLKRALMRAKKTGSRIGKQPGAMPKKRQRAA